MSYKEIAEIIRQGKMFDWICIHAHELSKEELKSIIKEYDYTMFKSGRASVFYNYVADCIEELED